MVGDIEEHFCDSGTKISLSLPYSTGESPLCEVNVFHISLHDNGINLSIPRTNQKARLLFFRHEAYKFPMRL
jgi:hypothetical protein